MRRADTVVLEQAERIFWGVKPAAIWDPVFLDKLERRLLRGGPPPSTSATTRPSPRLALPRDVFR